MLLCPVRGCRMELTREARRVVCPRGHSFDIARSGYINLLQPQERRSKEPGDSVAAVAARRRLHDRGISAPLLDGLTKNLNANARDVVLDAGCGDGFYLGSLAQRHGFTGHGIDISAKAVDLAARRYPQCEWIVANADRELPYSDESFSALLSITGRMNPAEFRRVLRKDGHLFVAVPAPDDLIELRGRGRDRSARTIEDFSGHFILAAQHRITCQSDLDAPAVQDVLDSIYRPLSSRAPEPMLVTFSLDVLTFSRTDEAC